MEGPHSEETKRKIGDATRRRHAERRRSLGLGPLEPKKQPSRVFSAETRLRMSEGAAKRRNPRMARLCRPGLLDVAWAAGIYEGEGTCGVFSKNAHDRPRDLRITVVQRDTEILHRLQKWFGGSVGREGPLRTTNYWRAYGARAAGFVMTVYGFLSQRRRAQVRKALQTMVAARGYYVPA